MCAHLGIAADCDVATFLALGAIAQNYVGDEGAGLAVESNGLKVFSGTGVASNVFSQFEAKQFPGKIGIAHNSCHPSLMMPVEFVCGGRKVALCADTTQEALQNIIQTLENAQEPLRGLKQVMHKVEAPFSILLLYDGQIIAARNNGRKPLSYGKFIDGISGNYVSSQSGVLGTNAEFIESIFPGEILILSQDATQRITVLNQPDPSRCVAQPLYLQRPGNRCGGLDTAAIRQAIGRTLAGKFAKTVWRCQKPESFIVLPIPEGGRHFGIGFSQESAMAIDPAGIVKNRYQRPSWFPSNLDLFPIGELVEGKNIAIVDDLILSGHKVQKVAQRCRQFGAREVHVVIGSIVRHACPYGVGAYSSQNLLDNLSAGEIQKMLNVESLTYLEVEELVGAINTPHRIYCTECL